MRRLLLFFLVSTVLCRDPVGQNIILLLVDGLGANLLNTTDIDTIGFRELIMGGVQAEYLRSSFPTQTWPNWMSLATGLNTENHGFTADYMWDTDSGLTFENGNGPNDTEGVWWLDRPAPFWYAMGKNGIDIHCYWFAHCHRPHYDMVVQVPAKRVADLTNPSQTEQLSEYFPEIVKRINKYQQYKRQVFLLRYAGLGTALRQGGSASDEADRALAKVDLLIHDLQQQLEEHGLFSSTNLIVMSDHGLAQIEEEQQFYLEECLSDYSKVKKVVNTGAMLLVFTEPEDETNVHFELRVCDQWVPMGDYEDSEAPMVTAYRLSELPDGLHWKNSRFMSGVVLLTKPGATIITRELPTIPANDLSKDWKMTSGWDPEAAAMQGVFAARGPAFKTNEKHGPINIVDVFQMVLNIVGLDPVHEHNGTWDSVGVMMTDGWEDRNSESMNGSSSSTFLGIVSIGVFFGILLRRI